MLVVLVVLAALALLVVGAGPPGLHLLEPSPDLCWVGAGWVGWVDSGWFVAVVRLQLDGLNERIEWIAAVPQQVPVARLVHGQKKISVNGRC